MEKILLLFVGALFVTAVHCTYTFPNYKRTTFGDSIDVASMKLLKEIYEQSVDKNVISSPLGVLILLALYASGSEGKTRDEIMALLGSTDYEQFPGSYSQLSERFASMDPNYLILANKVLVSDKYTLDEGFLNTAKTYKSEVDNINFNDRKMAADVINNWSSKKTKGLIDQPVSESDIDPAAAIALLNVIFFQGHWHVPFNASKTKEQDFNVDRSTIVKKPMMHLRQSLYYREDKEMGVKMIDLPYKESKFRMVVVLPNEVDGLPDVLDKAAEKGLLENIFRMHPTTGSVILDMPKFETRTKINLNDVLSKVGVTGIFKNASSGIVKELGVMVSKALQEAYVKVDEEGATAGAFTGVVATPLSSWSRPPPSIPFKVDRPFLYVILNDDIVLFAGTYTH
ncbi:antichymotrypsin-1-like isoform X2 [Nymphalis io]|uniref:antichymotrypsin-1-like isoform X2 n=1 Tax=Inachis io TaxID=171585 RepID=UPI002166E52F|nr:antichymotrypsin-1-like isoform X2 [Nymphalis io]